MLNHAKTDVLGDIENTIQDDIQDIIKTRYDFDGYEMTQEEAMQEFVAQYIEENIDSESFIQEISNNKPLLQRFVDWLSDVIKRFTGTPQEKAYIDLKNKYVKALNGEVITSNNQLDPSYFIGKDTNGNNIVIADNNQATSLSKMNKKNNPIIRNIIDTLIPLQFEINEDGNIVNFNKNSKKEYLNSTYSQYIKKYDREITKAKTRIVGNLGEVIEIANNGVLQKNTKQSHLGSSKIGANGFYHYNVKFASPIKNANGTIIDYQAYDGDLVIEYNADGSKNFYDIVDIKKSTVPVDYKSISSKLSLEQNSASNDIVANSSDLSTENNSKLSIKNKNIRKSTLLKNIPNLDTKIDNLTETLLNYDDVDFNKMLLDGAKEIYLNGDISTELQNDLIDYIVDNAGEYNELGIEK